MDNVTEALGVRELILNETPFTDLGLAHLANLKSLATLHINRTKVSLNAIQALQAALPGCKILSDHGNFDPK